MISKKWFYFLVVFLLLVFTVATYLGVLSISRSKVTITMPNLIGKNILQATTEIEKLNNLLFSRKAMPISLRIKYTFSEKIPKYVVIKQIPEPYISIKEGRIVTLTISAGAKGKIVPDLTGKSIDKVINAIYSGYKAPKRYLDILTLDVMRALKLYPNMSDFVKYLNKLDALKRTVMSCNDIKCIKKAIKSVRGKAIKLSYLYQLFLQLLDKADNVPVFRAEFKELSKGKGHSIMYLKDIKFAEGDKDGIVLSQIPEPGTEISSPTPLTLVVSVKPKLLKLPKFSSFIELINWAERNGIYIDLEYESGIKSFETIPEPGKYVKRGSTIKLLLPDKLEDKVLLAFKVPAEFRYFQKVLVLAEKEKLPFSLPNLPYVKGNGTRVSIILKTETATKLLVDGYYRVGEFINRLIDKNSVIGIYLNGKVFRVIKGETLTQW